MDRPQSFPNIWFRPPYEAYLGMANTVGIDRVVFATDYVSIREEEGEVVAHSTPSSSRRECHLLSRERQ